MVARKLKQSFPLTVFDGKPPFFSDSGLSLVGFFVGHRVEPFDHEPDAESAWLGLSSLDGKFGSV